MAREMESGMSPRKAMASGLSDKGNFGVEPMFGRDTGPHPDLKKGGAHLEDHERGIGMPVQHTKGMMPAQAAPDHGPHGHHPRHGGHDHFDRRDKA